MDKSTNGHKVVVFVLIGKGSSLGIFANKISSAALEHMWAHGKTWGDLLYVNEFQTMTMSVLSNESMDAVLDRIRISEVPCTHLPMSEGVRIAIAGPTDYLTIDRLCTGLVGL